MKVLNIAIHPLKKIVEENDISLVDNKKTGETFLVPSDRYEELKGWMIKGEYEVQIEDPNTMFKALVVDEIKEDINFTLNPVKIEGATAHGEETAIPKETEEMINKKVSVIAYHKPSGEWVGSESTVAKVRQFGETALKSCQKEYPETTQKDLALIVVDWSEKNINIEKLEK